MSFSTDIKSTSSSYRKLKFRTTTFQTWNNRTALLFWYECVEDTRSSIPFLRPLLSPRLEFCFSWKTAIEIAGVMLTRLSEINYFKAGPLMIDFFNSGRFLSLTQSNGFSTTKLRLLFKFQLFTYSKLYSLLYCIVYCM